MRIRVGVLAAGVLGFAGLCCAQPAPSVDQFKQALDKKLQKLKTEGFTERTVHYISVVAGKTPGHFRATLMIRDYGPGYPPNKFYGTTCVGKLEGEEFTMSPDDFGGWDVQGRMTPDLSTKQCKNNPSAGVSAMPPESVPGTQASKSSMPAPPVAAPHATPAPASGPGSMETGSYECWSSGRANLMLNFKVTAPGRYTDSAGKPGSFTLASNGRVTFKGGSLDGGIPAGYSAMYGKPGGRPTLSIRNSGGSETAFCQKR